MSSIKAKAKRRRTLRGPRALLERGSGAVLFMKERHPGWLTEELAKRWVTAARGVKGQMAKAPLSEEDHELLEQMVRDMEMLVGHTVLTAWAAGRNCAPIH